MGIFFKIFHLFERNEPHHELLEAYATLHELSSLLHQNLEFLRDIQKKIVGRKIATKRSRTGGIGLQKTLFIEEELVHKLKTLSETAESRFLKASEAIRATQPLSPLEKQELDLIVTFLRKIKSKMPDVGKISAIKSEKDKLLAVETALREVTNLSKEFHNIEALEKNLARKVLSREISPLLRKMYQHPDTYEYNEGGRKKVIQIFTVTENQLNQLEKEVRRINACQDPRYKIKWRRWWRDIQRPEKDEVTALKDPHINMTLKLFGRKKKDIHLLLAA